MPNTLAALLALSLTALACADAHTSSAGSLDTEWTHEVELRIGSVDDAATALTSVGSILSGDGGRFYVAQPQDAQVRIHGSTGELLGRLGRRGEGPGEFAALSFIGWWGRGRDTLWASDPQLRRLSLFLADGTFVRTIPLTTAPYREFMRPQVETVLPDGTLLGRPSYPSRLLAEGSITSIPMLRFGAAGTAEPVVEVAPGNGQLALAFGSAMSYSGQPWADSPLMAASGPAERVVVVERPAAARAEDARIRVTAIRATGDTLWSRDYPYAPLPLPAAEVDSARAARVGPVLGLAAAAGASRADVERQIREKLYAPAFRPPVTSVRISPEGSVWLQWVGEPDAELIRWLGIDAQGDPLGWLELPRNLRPVELGRAHAWAVETDELGVPYVVRLRIGPAEATP